MLGRGPGGGSVHRRDGLRVRRGLARERLRLRGLRHDGPSRRGGGAERGAGITAPPKASAAIADLQSAVPVGVGIAPRRWRPVAPPRPLHRVRPHLYPNDMPLFETDEAGP